MQDYLVMGALNHPLDQKKTLLYQLLKNPPKKIKVFFLTGAL